MVADEFEEEYLVFEDMLRNQVELAVESLKELKSYYNSQYSAIASRMLTDCMSTKFSNVDSVFVSNWKLSYASRSAMAIEMFKHDDLERETKNLWKTLDTSLATVFDDVNLLTECVKASSLPNTEQDYYSKKEIDMAVQNSVEKAFGPLIAKLNLIVGKISNKTEKN